MKKQELYKNITILIVTHNSERVIKPLLTLLDVNFPIFIVDNESKDKTKNILKKHNCVSKKIIFNKKGLGFGCAANIGLRKIKTKYVLLINPDTKINLNSISKLYEKTKIYPNAAILAPLHRNNDGKIHLPVRPFFYNKQKDLLNSNNFFGDCSVEYISGAIMLLDKKKISELGFFDEKFFLYYEDDDLCIKSRKNGFENVLLHDVVVDHFAGGSIGPPTIKNQWEKFFHMSFSRCYIEEKYFGVFKSIKISISIILKSAIKFFGHLVIFQFKKILKDIAYLYGALLFLLRIK